MSGRFAESVVEDAALACLDSLGYKLLRGPDIVVNDAGTERHDMAIY